MLLPPELSERNRRICQRIIDSYNNADCIYGMSVSKCWNEDFVFEGILEFVHNMYM